MKNQYEKLPKYIHSQIANALKKARLKRKLSKEDIARQTYLSVLDIIRIEKASSKATWRKYALLLQFFHKQIEVKVVNQPGLFSPERIFNKISALLKTRFPRFCMQTSNAGAKVMFINFVLFITFSRTFHLLP